MRTTRQQLAALGLLALFVFTFTAVMTVHAEDGPDVCSCCTTYCPDGINIAVEGHLTYSNGLGSPLYCTGMSSDFWCPSVNTVCVHMTHRCPGPLEP
jgi:hypothetical protein